MVHKIRILLLISIFLVLLCFVHKTSFETNLLKTLLPKQIVNYEDIVSFANKSSSLIKVVFESDSPQDLEELKQNFKKQTDTNYFEIYELNISQLLDKYLSQPTNFLSYDTRKLLAEKKYDTVYNKSVENLFNPAQLQLTTLDKDPFLLFDDFIASCNKFENGTGYIDGKYYNYVRLRFKLDESLSPNLSNKKIKQLINIQKNLSNKHAKIYFAGTPIHSYYTSKRAISDINIICILSTLIIIFLTYKYFKNLKLLFPMTLSIIFGLLCGYVATKLWFESFQIITMVFSTTLIGIGIDYSYHYFFADKIDGQFKKNLTYSLITTILPFILLYLTGIELLEQVSVFTIFGLIGIYLTVFFIYPSFEKYNPVKTYKPNNKFYKICIFILCLLSLAGLLRINFNDNLTALYNPPKTLSKAELLYNKVTGENVNTQIITVKESNINKIIKQEENITYELDKGNIEYISLSKFFPSEQRQRENFNLINDLYKNSLNKYSNILTENQINKLMNRKFVPVKFDNIYFKDFMLNPNTSMIIVFGNYKLNMPCNNVHIINFQSNIRHFMKHYRHILLVLFPVVILLLYVLLACMYDYKKALKILTPSLTGIFSSILLTSLIYGELNLFSIISIFLVLGFTIDYSIFRVNKNQYSESAIFVSCVTSSFSFLLLSLCGFKLLSSMALILFFGIVTSYLSGYLLFKNYGKIDL